MALWPPPTCGEVWGPLESLCVKRWHRPPSCKASGELDTRHNQGGPPRFALACLGPMAHGPRFHPLPLVSAYEPFPLTSPKSHATLAVPHGLMSPRSTLVFPCPSWPTTPAHVPVPHTSLPPSSAPHTLPLSHGTSLDTCSVHGPPSFLCSLPCAPRPAPCMSLPLPLAPRSLCPSALPPCCLCPSPLNVFSHRPLELSPAFATHLL